MAIAKKNVKKTSNKKPTARSTISVVTAAGRSARFGKLTRPKGRPSGVSSLFTVVAEKLSYELLSAVKKEHLAHFQEQNGVYIAHDSMGCPRYVGRGNVFNRLTARKKAYPDELTYFSYFIIKNRSHEREIETALIRAAGFSLVLNERKKRAGIASGDMRDFEAGTHYFERK